jgi:hypothetical protein
MDYGARKRMNIETPRILLEFNRQLATNENGKVLLASLKAGSGLHRGPGAKEKLAKVVELF